GSQQLAGREQGSAAEAATLLEPGGAQAQAGVDTSAPTLVEAPPARGADPQATTRSAGAEGASEEAPTQPPSERSAATLAQSDDTAAPTPPPLEPSEDPLARAKRRLGLTLAASLLVGGALGAWVLSRGEVSRLAQASPTPSASSPGPADAPRATPVPPSSSPTPGEPTPTASPSSEPSPTSAPNQSPTSAPSPSPPSEPAPTPTPLASPTRDPSP
ncbi:MAG TPA: hypothetical protein DEA08_27560, partial [Planctomycetes bacterium]|nr:hypothetical protein [Planctomycetota bacterium]